MCYIHRNKVYKLSNKNYIIKPGTFLLNYEELTLIERISENNRIFLVIFSLAILYLIGCYTVSISVLGHPMPITFEPQPDQIINSTQIPPNEITITFTERPEIKASYIKVTNSNNTRIDNNDLKLGNSEKELTISLNKSKLIFDDYTIKWLVFSKDDGFIVKGSYIFSYIS